MFAGAVRVKTRQVAHFTRPNARHGTLEEWPEQCSELCQIMASGGSKDSRLDSRAMSAPLSGAYDSLWPASGRLGPFVFVRRLGRGGFAPVWLANEVYNQTVLRRAAVKLFAVRPEVADGHPFATNGEQPLNIHRAILAEAAALCRVEHPNVVRFYSLARDDRTEGVIGLAMEYVDGKSLAQLLHERGRLSVAETVSIGLAVASALAAVHKVGLVHRDLKPANIVEAEGVCKLIDFGLATAESAIVADARPMLRLPSAQGPGLGRRVQQASLHTSAFDGLVLENDRGAARTITLGTKCGTLGYIDPSCMATGAPAAPASDLYALGVILFECLVGATPSAIALPSPRPSLRSEVLVGSERAPSLAELNPEVPRVLSTLIDSLLEPKRSARPQSAELVVQRLERVRWLLDPSERLPAVTSSAIDSPPLRLAEPPPWQGQWLPVAPPGIEEFRQGGAPLVYDGVALLTRGNALLVVYQAPARFHRTRWIFDCADRFASQCPEGIVCLMVVLSTADPPDARTRAENTRRFKKLGDSLRAMVSVPTGNSLWLSLVRSIMRGINAAQGTSNKFMVADTVDGAIGKLVEAAKSNGVQRVHVEDGLHALCGALGVELPLHVND